MTTPNLEIEATLKEWKEARSKTIAARDIYHKDVDKFLSSEQTKRPLTLGDMMFGLAVIDEIAHSFLHYLKKAIADPQGDTEYQSPLSLIEQDTVREKLFDLYFAHVSTDGESAEFVEACSGPNYRSFKNCEQEEQTLLNRLKKLRGQ